MNAIPATLSNWRTAPHNRWAFHQPLDAARISLTMRAVSEIRKHLA